MTLRTALCLLLLTTCGCAATNGEARTKPAPIYSTLPQTTADALPGTDAPSVWSVGAAATKTAANKMTGTAKGTGKVTSTAKGNAKGTAATPATATIKTQGTRGAVGAGRAGSAAAKPRSAEKAGKTAVSTDRKPFPPSVQAGPRREGFPVIAQADAEELPNGPAAAQEPPPAVPPPAAAAAINSGVALLPFSVLVYPKVQGLLGTGVDDPAWATGLVAVALRQQGIKATPLTKEAAIEQLAWDTPEVTIDPGPKALSPRLDALTKDHRTLLVGHITEDRKAKQLILQLRILRPGQTRAQAQTVQQELNTEDITLEKIEQGLKDLAKKASEALAEPAPPPEPVARAAAAEAPPTPAAPPPTPVDMVALLAAKKKTDGTTSASSPVNGGEPGLQTLTDIYLATYRLGLPLKARDDAEHLAAIAAAASLAGVGGQQFRDSLNNPIRHLWHISPNSCWTGRYVVQAQRTIDEAEKTTVVCLDPYLGMPHSGNSCDSQRTIFRLPPSIRFQSVQNTLNTLNAHRPLQQEPELRLPRIDELISIAHYLAVFNRPNTTFLWWSSSDAGEGFQYGLRVIRSDNPPRIPEPAPSYEIIGLKRSPPSNSALLFPVTDCPKYP